MTEYDDHRGPKHHKRGHERGVRERRAPDRARHRRRAHLVELEEDRERALAAVKVDKADVDLVVQELEVDRAVADRSAPASGPRAGHARALAA